LRGRKPQGRDHSELVPDKKLASVTDRGTVHSTNQDDVRIRTCFINSARVSIMVVCDGVSSGQNAEEASSIGASTACNFLFKHLTLGGDPKEAMRQAILAADSAIRGIECDSSQALQPSGATIVAAVAVRRRLIVGWVGDSRCYLIEPTQVQLLTHDHSWVNEVVDAGKMTEEQALKRPESHQISRCLGPLYGNQTTDIPEPAIAIYRLPETATVLLCTDGLWNYIPSLDVMASLVKTGPGAPDALTQTRSLVDFALAQGGKDNITAAMLTL
jgi:PPM family protein phosphatase